MILVRSNCELRLQEPFQEIVVDTDRDVELSLENDQEKCQVYIRLKKVGKFHLRTYHYAHSSCRILIWNALEESLETQEHHEVLESANVQVLYAELSKQGVHRDTWMALRERNAKGSVSSCGLVSSDFHMVQDVVNFAPETEGHIQNLCIVLKGGNLYLDAIGKIVQGAYRSQSHQQSRAMCFEEGQKSTIIPELIIDENDVQASHAMTIGRMDEEAMFYINSRGLSVKEATALIARGYLQLITTFLENEDLQASLLEELEGELAQL